MLDVPLDEPAPDASPDGGPTATTLLLVAMTGDGSQPAYGSAFTAGRWASVDALSGSDSYAQVGGGVTVLADGRGVATFRSNGGSLVQSATWSAGRWSRATPVGLAVTSYVGAPVSAGPDALVPRQSGRVTTAVSIDVFDAASSSWMTGAPTALLGDNVTIPALAVTSAGVPVVIDSTNPSGYRWIQRVGAAWSAPVVVTGVSPPGDVPSNRASIAAVARPGADQLVAVFSTNAPSRSGGALVAATFSAGVWSTPAMIATDAATILMTPSVLVPLPGGRVALAYGTSSNSIKVGFFDGTTWSAFRVVPGITPLTVQAGPFGAARGVEGGAVLELVYVDTTRHLRHTRLTDEAGWTWTPPVTIEATRTWATVAIAAGP